MAAQIERSRLVENLAESFGTKANAQSIFGPLVERKGITVIPVGKIRYGLGGGSGVRGQEREGAGAGDGGGGGVIVSPIGYIELKDGNSRFRRINSPMAILQVMGGIALSSWLMLRGVRALRMR